MAADVRGLGVRRSAEQTEHARIQAGLDVVLRGQIRDDDRDVDQQAPRLLGQLTQRLFDEGFIAQVRAMVAPRKVGKGALVMVGVVLDRSTPESFAAFERAIAQLKFVLDCHLVAGDFDYFLKIRVGDMEDFNRIHGEQLIALPGVRQTRTFFVMKEVVDNAPLDF